LTNKAITSRRIRAGEQLQALRRSAVRLGVEDHERISNIPGLEGSVEVVCQEPSRGAEGSRTLLI
jgi:hypothetical protein